MEIWTVEFFMLATRTADWALRLRQSTILRLCCCHQLKPEPKDKGKKIIFHAWEKRHIDLPKTLENKNNLHNKVHKFSEHSYQKIKTGHLNVFLYLYLINRYNAIKLNAYNTFPNQVFSRGNYSDYSSTGSLTRSTVHAYTIEIFFNFFGYCTVHTPQHRESSRERERRETVDILEL